MTLIPVRQNAVSVGRAREGETVRVEAPEGERIAGAVEVSWRSGGLSIEVFDVWGHIESLTLDDDTFSVDLVLP